MTNILWFTSAIAGVIAVGCAAWLCIVKIQEYKHDRYTRKFEIEMNKYYARQK